MPRKQPEFKISTNIMPTSVKYLNSAGLPRKISLRKCMSSNQADSNDNTYVIKESENSKHEETPTAVEQPARYKKQMSFQNMAQDFLPRSTPVPHELDPSQSLSKCSNSPSEEHEQGHEPGPEREHKSGASTPSSQGAGSYGQLSSEGYERGAKSDSEGAPSQGSEAGAAATGKTTKKKVKRAPKPKKAAKKKPLSKPTKSRTIVRAVSSTSLDRPKNGKESAQQKPPVRRPYIPRTEKKESRGGAEARQTQVYDFISHEPLKETEKTAAQQSSQGGAAKSGERSSLDTI